MWTSGLVDDRKEKLDALMLAIEATPEQENRIRGMFREFGAENGFRPSAEKTGELARKVLAKMTAEQRVKAVKVMRGEK